jgi:hypothetical protein
MRRYLQAAARKLGWDRNPLRRRIDRAETVVLTTLVAALVIVGPLLAIFASHVAESEGSREQRAERGSYDVTAVLTQSTGQAVIESGQMDGAWVRARWTEHGGRRETGEVVAPLSSQAGQRVQVWLTRGGQVTSAPLSNSEVDAQALYAAVLAVICWFAVLQFAAILVHVLADRHRMSAWQREWAAFESRRSHQG